MSQRLNILLDKFEIQELLTAYAHAIDSRDFGLLDDLFTADADIDYTASGGIKGQLETIKPFLQGALPMFKATQHFVTNPLIKLSGDVATSRSLLFNTMTMKQDSGNRTLLIGAWYNDELIRTEEGWRIAKRWQDLAFLQN
jgi:3-phenylpropionate/cinnamic acid dioxygenase small subunit